MYTIEQDSDCYNVFYIVAPDGTHIFRHTGDRLDLEDLLYHLNGKK